ncbi:MAG: hypothetical protein VKL60_00345, partial [Sphaerospermopsis sp.]|nr:hypothetical protein [Sphaerospermopsis sp.]
MAETGQYVDPNANIINLTLKNILTGDEETKIKNYKELFGNSVKEIKKDKEGNPLITLAKDGKEQTFYINRPNETLSDWIQDTPQFALDTAIFMLGSKGLGALGTGIASKFPMIGKAGSAISSVLNPTVQKIGTEGFKAGAIELTKEAVATEGEMEKSVRDAGIEALSSMAMDTAIAGATRVPNVLSKLPTKLGGDLAGSMRKKVGEWMYGSTFDPYWKYGEKITNVLKGDFNKELSVGGDKAFAGSLGALPLGEKTKNIIEKTIETENKKIKVNDLAREIVREMPISDAEKSLLAKNVTAEKAEVIIASDMVRTIRENAKNFQKSLVESLKDANGNHTENSIRISKLDPIEFITTVGKNNNPEYVNIYHVITDYVNSPSPFKTKPSELLTGSGIELKNIETRAMAQTLGENPKTIQEYIENYNKNITQIYKNLPDAPPNTKMVKDGKVVPVAKRDENGNIVEPKLLNIDTYFKATDEDFKWLKNVLNHASFIGGLAGTGMGFFTKSPMSGAITGLVAYSGLELLGNVIQKNPKATIDAIQDLAKIQKATIDPKTGHLISGLTPEQVISAKRFLFTKDVGDFGKYLMHTIRRNSELRQDWRQKGEEATAPSPVE